VSSINRLVPLPAEFFILVSSAPRWQGRVLFPWRGPNHRQATACRCHPITESSPVIPVTGRPKSDPGTYPRALCHHYPADDPSSGRGPEHGIFTRFPDQPGRRTGSSRILLRRGTRSQRTRSVGLSRSGLPLARQATSGEYIRTVPAPLACPPLAAVPSRRKEAPGTGTPRRWNQPGANEAS
jgi:hypothetical protein